MEQDYEPSPIIPIGSKKYFSVEYPGYVKRTKRAIETLGGEKALCEALASDSPVELRFRPKDPFSHPISGQILPTSKLLVKVTRRVKKNSLTGEAAEDSETKWKTEIKGVVTKTLRFRALADFQYLVPKEDKIRQLKQALVQGDVEHIMNYKIATDDDNREDLRNIPPPIFTPVEGALSYGYRQNAPVLRVRVRQTDGSFKVKLLNRSRQTGFEITAIKFHEENVPTKSWHNIPPITKPEEDKAVIAVAKLFEERPVWSRFAIKNQLPSVHHLHMKAALIRNAYTFTDGPWRDCWIKYGVDPRKHQKYHIYQQVDVRRFFSIGPRPALHGRQRKQKGRQPKSKASVAASEQKPETKTLCTESETKHIFDGKNIPGASSLYQICDITDPDIKPIIDNPEYLKPEASKYCGFYYQCVLERIRKSVRKKHLSLLETGKADRLPNADEGLMEEVLKEKESKKEVEGYEGIEGEDEEDNASAAAASNEDAVREALRAMNHSETNKRLKEVVDEYMDELVKEKSSNTNDFEEEEVDLDVMDALEEYDEEFDGLEEDEEDGQPQSDAIKPEPNADVAQEDVTMEEP